jgi:hypothetical protein
MNEERTRFTVWVGGVEVNDYHMTETDAQKLADEYKAAGYDDTAVVEKEAVWLSNYDTETTN